MLFTTFNVVHGLLLATRSGMAALLGLNVFSLVLSLLLLLVLSSAQMADFGRAKQVLRVLRRRECRATSG